MLANEYHEFDGAGKLTTIYVASGYNDTSSRVDIVKPPDSSEAIWQALIGAFLPVGYPSSVTDDYLSYQIYDSFQAFSSSIAGLLSSRAVLEGVGVGDALATPTAALLLEIVQESMGRVATILFAHRLGTALEPECKMYRLAADVFNDAAMILDCLSPAFPKAARVMVLGLSSVLRALCGVAAGSSKASLSAHFAKCGNLGELNAKDSSQETVIGLLGMLVGSMIVSRVTSPEATWMLLITLLAVHLSMNYAAVRAVRMRSLNRQRANLVFSQLIDTGEVLTPEEIGEREVVFERDGVLRWRGSQIVGYAVVGVTMQSLLQSPSLGSATAPTGSIIGHGTLLTELLEVFRMSRYLLWYESPSRQALVVLKQGAVARDQLRGWVHALVVAKRLAGGPSDALAVLSELRQSLALVEQTMERHASTLEAKGYDLDTAAIETAAGVRVAFGRDEGNRMGDES